MIPTNVHSYSRTFAIGQGITAAVILKHIAHKVRHSKNIREGKKWHYNSVRKLTEKFPYYSASTIASSLRALEKNNFIVIGNYNHWKQDRTQWFHVDEEFHPDLEEDLIRFDSEVAEKVGVLAAALHFNLHHFISNQLKKKQGKNKAPKHVMSPKALAKLLNCSASAVKKALKKLTTEELIVKCDGPRSTYTLPADEILLLQEMK